MRKRSRKPPHRKIILRLPDLDHTKAAVLNSLSSPHSRRNYKFAMEQFIAWYCSEPRHLVRGSEVCRTDAAGPPRSTRSAQLCRMPDYAESPVY